MLRLGLILGFFVQVMCLAASPRWAESFGTETGLDTAEYVSGFGTANETGMSDQGLKSAKEEALSALAKQIKVTIDHKSRLKTAESGGQVTEDYLDEVKTWVTLDLFGVEKYETEFDRASNRWLALAVLRKSAMLESLNISRIKEESLARVALDSIVVFGDMDNLETAKRKLADADRLIDDLLQNLILSQQMGAQIDANLVIGPLYQTREILASKVSHLEICEPQDIVQHLAQDIPWSTWTGKTILILPAVYRTSDFTGSFFGKVCQLLVNELQSSAKTIHVTSSSTSQPDIVLKGYYSEVTDGWKLHYTLSSLKTGHLLTSWECVLPKKLTDTIIPQLLPENFDVAVEDHNRQQAAPIGISDLAVWTNKGTEDLIFEQGDRVRFHVRSQRSGYLTMIYNLAGPQRLRVPLIVNYSIPKDQVGKDILIGEEFEITPPFGAEAAQFIFTSNRLPPPPVVSTESEGETYQVLAEDYDQFLLETRGRSIHSNTDSDPWYCEKTLTLTTLAKTSH